MFSCKICKIFKKTYFEEHLQTTASAAQVLFNDFHQKCFSQLFLEHFSTHLLRSLLCSHKETIHIILSIAVTVIRSLTRSRLQSFVVTRSPRSLAYSHS